MADKAKSKKKSKAKKTSTKKERTKTQSSVNKKLTREPAKSYHDVEVRNPFGEDTVIENRLFIECPGATVYEPGTRNITTGVNFIDENDPAKGHTIVDHPVFAPDHKKRRMIKKEHRNSIRRCQACQDLTVRLIRREGPDFFIPNPRFPRKKQLKPVEKTW